MGRELSAEHKKPKKIITEGIFSVIRHPQNLAGAILHVRMCIVLSAWYVLLFTPVLVTFDYLVAKKEEKELLQTFREEYEEFMAQVPIFIPRLRKKDVS